MAQENVTQGYSRLEWAGRPGGEFAPLCAPHPTYLSEGSRQFAGLWRAVFRRECPAPARRLFGDLLGPWGDDPIPPTAPTASCLSDDHSPYEFSVALDGDQPELRVLVEAQSPSATAVGQWHAGRALSERLARDHGADLARLKAVEGRFYPADAAASFGVWHAVCFGADGPPACKAYLNPQARGAAASGPLVLATLAELGFGDALPALERAMGPRGDDFAFLSVDLSASADARVKVYVRQRDATSADVERIAALAGDLAPGTAGEFCRAMAGGEGPYGGLPMLTCLTFVGSRRDAPSAATVHVPVRASAPNDAVAAKRLRAYLGRHGGDADVFDRGAAALARRPLAERPGLYAYTSLRAGRGGRSPRVTAYLSAELFTTPVGFDPGQ